ncbi:hypothetical protein LAWI1_G005621 [Lachnellula willkommii]|uniref:Cyclase n=1 Tax=Lachnellula willkommii TaxID=215461 RepID=A0A559MDY5_9HELO|nr:hypothetical protein LAWI1_G005621 [Lachnellula willkommii]
MEGSHSPPARPAFCDLPLSKDGPQGNIWGLFGENDELGLLNYITPEITRQATKEIKSGIRIPLDLPLNHFATPSMGRQPFKHEMLRFEQHLVNDEVVTMNTQSGTQWDGFRHFGYQDVQRYYNDCKHEELENSTRNGIHVWTKHGGIVSRGVLLDYGRWAASQGIKKPFFESSTITVFELNQVAASQKVSLHAGDVLLVRSGYIVEHQALSPEAQLGRHQNPLPASIGLESSEEMLEYLWDSGIVAVAGDMPTLEAWPMQSKKFLLHEWLLAGWGCPIGEYFDLEKLSEQCEKAGRWSFFFSSVPMNIPGGVASPANAIAIL